MEKENKSQDNTSTEAKDTSKSLNTWLDAWLEVTRKFASVFTPTENGNSQTSSCQDWFNSQKGAFSKIASGNPLFSIFEKLLLTTNIHSHIMKLWASLLPLAGPEVSSEKIKEVLSAWSENQKEIFAQIMGAPFANLLPTLAAPADFVKFVEVFNKTINTWLEAYAVEYKPLLDNLVKISQKLSETAKKDFTPESCADFYSSWLAGYEATLDRFLNIPAIGPMRQYLEKFNKSLDSYVKYIGASADFYLKLMQPSTGALEEIAAKTAEILKGEINDEKYREFYDLLIRTFEKRFHELLSSEGFTQTLKTTLETSLDFRKSLFDLLEDLLKNTPIVTRTEIDDVHKEIYLLKKKVKELTYEVEVLREKRR